MRRFFVFAILMLAANVASAQTFHTRRISMDDSLSKSEILQLPVLDTTRAWNVPRVPTGYSGVNSGFIREGTSTLKYPFWDNTLLFWDAISASTLITNLLPTQSGHASQFLQTDGAGTLSWQDCCVKSVFGRTGVVTAQSGDYSFGQVSGTATIAQGGTNGTTQAAAIKNLMTDSTGQTGKFWGVKAGGGLDWLTPPGSVTSVSGTTNRITSTGGATPVIDISSSYVGQSSITTLGTIGTGTWNATTLDVPHGGSNATTLTGVLLGHGTSAFTGVSLPSDPTKFLDGNGAFNVPSSGVSASSSGKVATYTGANTVGGDAEFQYAAGEVQLGSNGGNAGSVLLYGTGAGHVILTAPITITSYFFGFPAAEGTLGQPLVSAGAGSTQFATLGIAGGGTGSTTIAPHSVLTGQGTSPIGAITSTQVGDVLTGAGSGADPTFQPHTVMRPVASVDLSVAAATKIFTVPAGVKFNALRAWVVIATASGASGTAQIDLGYTGPNYLDFGVITSISSPSVDEMYQSATFTGKISAAAATDIYLYVFTPFATGSVTGTVYIEGFYY